MDSRDSGWETLRAFRTFRRHNREWRFDPFRTMTLDPRSLFEGKKITVMGLGLLGRGLMDTLFLAKSGSQVTVTDLKNAEQLAPSLKELEGLPIKIKLGGHDPEDFINADMMLRNADVPRSSPFLKLAADHRVPIEMDESLFCKHFEGKIVGIT